MATKRRHHSGEFKAKVAVAAFKGDKTVNEIASQFQVHSMHVSQWKKQSLEGLPELLGDRRRERDKDGQTLIDNLYQQIGRQKVEWDWLKKIWPARRLSDVLSWTRITTPSAYADNANCSGWRGPASITSRAEKVRRTCD